MENPYFYLWVMSSVTSSLYAYVWDIKMDWGLLENKEKSRAESRYLREEIVYDKVVSTFSYAFLQIFTLVLAT